MPPDPLHGRRLAVIVLFAAACLATAAPGIALQPLGPVPEGRLRAVAACLRSRLGQEVSILAPRPLPASAWYAPRGRYRAETLVADLAAAPGPCPRIVGITQADISTTLHGYPDWGIFGLGSLGGRACVISLYRLGRGPHGAELLEGRLQKVAVHELGHTYGLPHCPARGCVMEDAAGRIATVDQGGIAFCQACQRHLDAQGKLGGGGRLCSKPSP
jgi:archaemetzincin